MELRLYNTLTKRKDEFKSIEEKKVKMYNCGPTVYSYASIGNFRTYIFIDTLKRVLKYNGYEINSVMNITDVGHLTSDADTGEDKMEKAAKKEGKDPFLVAKYYSECFFKDFDRLKLERPTTVTNATDNIPQMIEMVEEIIKNGYAYETSKGIYFDVSKLDKYPVLSNYKLDDLEAGARIEVDPEKRNPYDFAIWIKAPEEHIMKWDSPWGKSYPGWHLECSVMGRRFLGESFDIHTGGVDHIPVHHENEIAQDKGAFGKNPANYWMHCEFLLIDGGKMSKSLQNVYTIDQIQEKGISPLGYKMFCHSSHYRNKLNFTFESALAAEVSLRRLYELYIKHNNGENNVDSDILENYEEEFLRAINDDLNMSAALSVVWKAAKNNNYSKKIAELLLKFDEVLGLDIENSEKYINNSNNSEIPEEILEISRERDIARKNKDWQKSDELRDLIASKGFSIKDSKEGTIITKQ